jgi:hypothetical protein
VCFSVIGGKYGQTRRPYFVYRVGDTIPTPNKFQFPGKRTKTTLRFSHRRAEHAFSPPFSLGKAEGAAIAFPLLQILAFDMHFPIF